MTSVLRDLFLQVTPDPWRATHAYTGEMKEAHEVLFRRREDAAEVLNHWIRHYQPCLFGKIAAAGGLISYCVLTEDDLNTDERVRDRIQACRRDWKRQAFDGRRSGFVIAFVSERFANATPDEVVLRFAQRLASLYLQCEVAVDTVYFDDLFLELPGPKRTSWEWDVGVNYFSAHGDGRWWKDHRIPGGMAFSMNSVGHMVKAGAIHTALAELAATLGVADEGWADAHLDSLPKALSLAMRTINNAQETTSGRATRLITLAERPARLPCPTTLTAPLDDKNHCEYAGYYHTDFTIPHVYFVDDVNRQSGTQEILLDFTYLFDEALDNPEYLRMGEGVQIRQGDMQPSQGAATDIEEGPRKRGRAVGRPAATKGESDG